MKHLSTYTLILLSCIFLLASCGSLSIEKRRYNSGFSIHSSHHKTGRQIAEKENDKNKILATNEESALKQDATHGLVIENQVEEDFRSLSSNNEDNSEIETYNSSATNDSPNPVKEEELKIQKHNPVSSLKTAVKNQSKYSSDDDEGLSLLGLLVLVVLILWLLGYLSGGWGLGGAIHLILLVAVVLLILWLLRII